MTLARAREIEQAWVVIAAYNEEKTIASTLSDVFSFFSNAVVVDDFSSDDTSGTALAAGAYVCRHPINLGQGAALATGIRFALSHGAEIIVTFDADGQHSAADALKMARLLQETRCDIVLGSRFLGKTIGMSKRKRWFLKAAIMFERMSTGLKVTDAHNGLRVFSRRAAEAIKIRQNRMAHASEILRQIRMLGLGYKEAPCTITYTDYSKAKGQRMTGAFAILADLTLRRLYK